MVDVSCVRVNEEGVAVDQAYFWQPMSTCPLSSKVQLLTTTGVAVYGSGNPKALGYVAWAALPKRPLWLIKDQEARDSRPSIDPHGY